MIRLGNKISAARKILRERIDQLVEPLGPKALIAARWPWPVRKPWQRSHLTLCSASGIGDELMCTAIFREIKRRNPSCEITFISRHPALFRGNKDVDRLVPATEASALQPIRLKYGPPTPPRFPLLTVMGACVGLEPPFDTSLTAPELEVSPDFQARIAAIPRPFVVIQTRSSKWTPNKDWPEAYWRELVARLTTRWHVLDTGGETALANAGLGSNYHSFIGATSLPEFAYLVREAGVFVGPVSGGMHVANAFETPAVILFGGYEKPEGHFMPRARSFYSAVECAPCWLNERCPHDRKCLKAIAPGEIFAAVEQILSSR